MKFLKIVIPALALVSGCATYQWQPSVPEDVRSVSVPIFRNDSEDPQLGSIVTRQVLREFQREGTFKLVKDEDAMVEVQGVIRSANTSRTARRRRDGGFSMETFDLKVNAVVSVIDRKNGRVLIDERKYVGDVPFDSRESRMTSRRDAFDRAAEDIARQVVDDVLNLKW